MCANWPTTAARSFADAAWTSHCPQPGNAQTAPIPQRILSCWSVILRLGWAFNGTRQRGERRKVLGGADVVVSDGLEAAVRTAIGYPIGYSRPKLPRCRWLGSQSEDSKTAC